MSDTISGGGARPEQEQGQTSVGSEGYASAAISVPSRPAVTGTGTPIYVAEGEQLRLGYEAAAGAEYYGIWDKGTGSVEKFAFTEEGWRRAWTSFAGLEPSATATPPPAGVAAPTQADRRRKVRQGLSIGAGGAVAVAIALRFILAAVLGSTTAPGGVLNKTVFTEDFNKPSAGWAVGANSRRTDAFVGGAYEIVTKAPKDDSESFKYLTDKTFSSVAVQVQGTQSGGAGLWGVICLSTIDPSASSASGYLFAIDPVDQGWVVGRAESATDQTVLGQGVSSAIHASGANVLHAECRGSGAGQPTTLVFTINGTTVKTFQDSTGFAGYRGIGLSVYSDEGETQVLFDNASMQRL